MQLVISESPKLGAVVRARAFPFSVRGGAMTELSFLDLYFAPRGFSPGTGSFLFTKTSVLYNSIR